LTWLRFTIKLALNYLDNELMKEYLGKIKEQIPAKLKKIEDVHAILSDDLLSTKLPQIPKTLFYILQFISSRYLSGGNSLTESRRVSIKRLFLNKAINDFDDKEGKSLVISFTNYVTALKYLKTKSYITKENINTAHAILIGNTKIGGKLRNKQNYVAKNQKEYQFIPPIHTSLPYLINDLVKFINNKEISPLVRAYHAYTQFSLIHPYLDGNGRMARLLWDRLITDTKFLLNPSLYRLVNGSLAKYKGALEISLKPEKKQLAKEYWGEIFAWSTKNISTIKIEYFKFYINAFATSPLLMLRLNSELIQLIIENPIINEAEPIFLKGVGSTRLHETNMYKKRTSANGAVIYECKIAIQFLIKIEQLLFN